jgi:nucleotide-binding universal stress UspA family protein
MKNSRYATILVAIDGTDQRHRVLAAAAELARLAASTVHVLHVDTDTVAFDTGNHTEPDGSARQLVDEALAELGSHGITAEGVLGTAADADIDDVILGVAHQRQADLIIVGPNYRHGLSAWLQPSVADEISHRSPSPVLLVP